MLIAKLIFFFNLVVGCMLETFLACITLHMREATVNTRLAAVPDPFKATGLNAFLLVSCPKADSRRLVPHSSNEKNDETGSG